MKKPAYLRLISTVLFAAFIESVQAWLLSGRDWTNETWSLEQFSLTALTTCPGRFGPGQALATIYGQ
jgi:hypothetical protein